VTFATMRDTRKFGYLSAHPRVRPCCSMIESNRDTDIQEGMAVHGHRNGAGADRPGETRTAHRGTSWASIHKLRELVEGPQAVHWCA